MSEHLDVLVVGAGLSGIAAGYYIQTKLPTKRFAILESRGALGGTWDLFRYPGIRSDSDMFTLGYSFRPWRSDRVIADGGSILAYLTDTAREYGIDRAIRFHHTVERAAWSSETGRWTIEGHSENQPFRITANFLLMCAGYYHYDSGYTPELPGIERYRGRIVHPQTWTDDIDYTDKRVVVIGSGATAVTLVPALAERAAHVTMLQRTPSYVLSIPSIVDPIAGWLQRRFSPERAGDIARWKNALLSRALYDFCRTFPTVAKKLFKKGARDVLGPDYDVDTHFTPPYEPWDQRLCLIPEGDLFTSLRSGRAEVVTDHIAGYTETGLLLRSGRTLDADLIVTATGLRLQFMGGLSLTVDGTPVDLPTRKVYRGTMISDVPNLAFVVGYTNASWTLKAELILQYVCRVIAELDRTGNTHATARPNADVGDEPLLDLASGYVQRAAAGLPRQGKRTPWRVYQHYVRDYFMLKRGRIADGVLELARARRYSSAIAGVQSPSP
ncbi:MAG: NAD(P)/FAD-dependent oxidoreductase [Kofleriaceae bacterium]